MQCSEHITRQAQKLFGDCVRGQLPGQLNCYCLYCLCAKTAKCYVFEDLICKPSHKHPEVSFCSFADPTLKYSLSFDFVQGRTLICAHC